MTIFTKWRFEILPEVGWYTTMFSRMAGRCNAAAHHYVILPQTDVSVSFVGHLSTPQQGRCSFVHNHPAWNATFRLIVIKTAQHHWMNKNDFCWGKMKMQHRIHSCTNMHETKMANCISFVFTYYNRYSTCMQACYTADSGTTKENKSKWQHKLQQNSQYHSLMATKFNIRTVKNNARHACQIISQHLSIINNKYMVRNIFYQQRHRTTQLTHTGSTCGERSWSRVNRNGQASWTAVVQWPTTKSRCMKIAIEWIQASNGDIGRESPSESTRCCFRCFRTSACDRCSPTSRLWTSDRRATGSRLGRRKGQQSELERINTN